MSITATCTHCKHGFTLADSLAGSRVQCPKCQKFFALPAGAAAGSSSKSLPAVVYWLGLVALGAGVLALLFTPLSATLGFARFIAWLGLLLGCVAAAVSFFREDCGCEMPIAGMMASVLTLAVVVLGIGADPLPGGWHPGVKPAPRTEEERKGPDGGRRRGPGEPGQGGPGQPRKGGPGPGKDGQAPDKGKDGAAAQPPAEPAK